MSDGKALAVAWTLGLMCAASLGAPAQAHACECAYAQGIEESEEKSSAIFFGEVTRFQESDGGVWRATFDVAQVYKGDEAKVGAPVVVETRVRGKQCGVDFKKGQTYLVFANNKVSGALGTSTCHFTEAMEEAPVDPVVRSLAPLPPGDGDVRARFARADAVFTGKLVEAGEGFGGSWDGVDLTIEVMRPFKGVEAKERVQVSYASDTCNAGEAVKKEDIFSDDNMDIDLKMEAPFEVGATYVVFASGDGRMEVQPCHDNFARAEEAGAQLARLRAMCSGSSMCAPSKRTTMRRALRAQVLERSRASLETCAKKAPLYSKRGALTRMELTVEMDGRDQKAQLVDVQVRGSIEGAEIYDAAVACIGEQVPKWEVMAFPGRSATAKVVLNMRDAPRGPRYREESVSIRYR